MAPSDAPNSANGSATAEAAGPSATLAALATLWRPAYRVVAYFGLMSLMAALVWGFRYDPTASRLNYVVDILLYAAFIAPHLMLTRSEVKQSVWRSWAGTLRERQLYILITIVTWLAVLWLHRPVPGGEVALPEAVRFAGLVGTLWAMLMFFQGITVEMLDGLLGVHGTGMQYSHGAQTPLLTEGPYSQVRHPQYRAVVLMGVAALVYHPNAAQLLWTLLLGATFVGFIPLEEAQLREARGDEYRRYCQQTPYRLFRYIW